MPFRDLPFMAGVITGIGLALFIIFVVAQAEPIEISGAVRIGFGAVGLALWAVGGLLRGRLRTTGVAPAGAEKQANA